MLPTTLLLQLLTLRCGPKWVLLYPCRSARPSSQMLLLTCLLAGFLSSHAAHLHTRTHTHRIFVLLLRSWHHTFQCRFYLTDKPMVLSHPVNFWNLNLCPKLTFDLNRYPNKQLCKTWHHESQQRFWPWNTEPNRSQWPKAAIQSSEPLSFSPCQQLLVHVSAPLEHDLLPNHCSHFNTIDLLIKFK